MHYHNWHNAIQYFGVPRGEALDPCFSLVFQGFHRNLKLKTSKHEFAGVIHQNKQGFDGKKPCGPNLGAIGSNAIICDIFCIIAHI